MYLTIGSNNILHSVHKLFNFLSMDRDFSPAAAHGRESHILLLCTLKLSAVYKVYPKGFVCSFTCSTSRQPTETLGACEIPAVELTVSNHTVFQLPPLVTTEDVYAHVLVGFML